MRRSIQIVSACALIMVVTGPGVWVRDGLAAEGEKLPCNNLCRTWMGYEGGGRAAPLARTDETVAVKPSEAQLDPGVVVDQSASKTDATTDPTTDGADKLRRAKPKRKGERDTVDVSNRRSATTQSQMSKPAKNLVSHDDVVSNGRSGSGSSRNRPLDQAEENVGKPPAVRNETSSGSAKVVAHGVPLPPRLPRDARPNRSDVARAGLATDQTHASAVDKRKAKPSTQADSTADPHSGSSAAEPGVSHPATESGTSLAARTRPKTVAVGSHDADAGTAVARSPGLSVMPAKDPRAGTRELSGEDLPGRTTPAAAQARAVDGHVIAGAPAVGVVAPASDPSRSTVASKVDALPPALPATGETASKILPNIVSQKPAAVAADGAAPTEGRAAVSGSGSDKKAANVDAIAAAPNATNPPADKGSAVSLAETTVVVPPVPTGRVVGPASTSGKQSALVASAAEASQTASSIAGGAASISSPKAVEQGAQVATNAAADPKAVSATTAIGAARDPIPPPSSQPERAVTAPKVALPEQATVHPADTHVAALNEVQTMSVPPVSQSPAALPNAHRDIMPNLDSKAEQPSIKAPISSGDAPLGNDGNAYRANLGETASMASPSGAATNNAATLVTIAVNDVSAQPEKTTIGYTITNLAASPLDILFIRCNAVDPKGTIVGSVFDYVVNIPAGQEIKRSVRLPSESVSGQTFSCANDAATH